MTATLPNGSGQPPDTGTHARGGGVSLVMLLAGSLLVGFSMGQWLAPLAAWIGPVLIMRYSRDHKAGRGYLFVLPALVLAFIIGFGAMWTYFGPPAVPIFAVLFGWLWSLPYLADRLVASRLGGFSSTLVYPLAATTLEFLIIHVNPVGTWGATGFSQYGNLPLMQLASVTGMIGITFVMGWFASVANWAWENQTRGRLMLRGVAVFGTVLAVVLAFGFVRLNLASSGETIRVAGITAEGSDAVEARMADAPDTAAIREIVESLWAAYFDETVREAQAGAKVVTWPEQAGWTSFSDQAASLLARAQDVARQNGIYLAIGLWNENLDTGEPKENKFVLIDPTGAIVIDHIKYGGIFDHLRGERTLQAVATPFGVVSGVICWDLDFPAVIQKTGLNDTALILVPSRDWREIDPAHSQMAVFRAIENGMSVVRQTDKGLSIASDPYGRTLAQTDFFDTTDRTMVAQVPVQHVATVYTAFGRWFEWLSLVGFLYVVARALMARRVDQM